MMKKRLQIGKLLKGDKRLEGETFVEYKERLKLEMEKRGLWGWRRWFWSILGYY